ncbi:LPS export ABC transporter periplasmic protein LptC [Porticoccaceae bacterium LTM1]|nr:LPS export ABC transporter periplasmic protein LptC [Porticoccaceae bacterium LTM1]
MIRTSLIFIILLAGIVAFIDFWDSPPEKFFKSKTTTVANPKANVFMTNTETRQFGENGQLQFQLNTVRSEHYENEERFELSSPVVTAHQDKRPPWVLTAEKGVITEKDKKMLLSGEVLAEQTLTGNRYNKIATPELTFHFEKKFAETDKPVTLTTPESLTTGVGMTAELERGLYKLGLNPQSRVKSQYDAK